MDIFIARIAYPVTALGPGRRLAVWTSGCSRRCPGCISPDILEQQPAHRMELNDLVTRIEALDIPLDGITLSGGDPLDQPYAVAEFLSSLRSTRPDWNVIVYTGYLLETLKKDPARSSALKSIDLLIDGPYQEDLSTQHPLIGSSNQRFHTLSDKGKALLAQIDTDIKGRPHFNLAVQEGPEALLVGVGTRKTRELAHARINNPSISR